MPLTFDTLTQLDAWHAHITPEKLAQLPPSTRTNRAYQPSITRDPLRRKLWQTNHPDQPHAFDGCKRPR